jgi:putative spermidine/putrescine transport system permease protein
MAGVGDDGARARAVLPIVPILVVLTLGFYAPLGFFLALSFLRYDPAHLYLHQWTFANYHVVLTESTYRLGLFNTLRLALAVAACTVVLGYGIAVVLWRSSPGWRNVLITALIAPLFVSVIIRTYGWLIIFDNRGPLNEMLRWVSLGPLHIRSTLTAVVVALTEVELPFATLPIFATLSQVDRALVEAAATLGEPPLRAFARVVVPLSLPGVVTGGILAFSLAASSFVEPLVLAPPNLFLLATLAYDDINQVLNWPLGAATGFFLLAVALLLTAVSVGALRLTRGGRMV